MQTVRFCHILLFLLISSLFIEQAHAQGGSIIQRVVDAVTSAVGDVGSFFSAAINTLVLQVATVVIGDDPEDLACSLIQDELAKQDGTTCTCKAELDVITSTADMDGTCTIDRTCPVPGICGTCEATYEGTGDLTITDQTIDGTANLKGVCALNEITIRTTATNFVFTAKLDLNGGFDSLKMDIASCSASFEDDSTGTTVATCTCSPKDCGELQVSFNCTGEINLASSGCVSITGGQ